MTFPGTPCIYYGDEIGLVGGKDPGSRGAFPWHDRASWDEDLLEYFKKATRLRSLHPALRRGRYRTLYASGSTFAFERANEEEQLIVAFNAGAATSKFVLPAAPGIAVSLFGGLPNLRVDGGRCEIELPPRSGGVWKIESA
jgi:cyclomaltodextrinase / maltogenic alpha-amylase / neopullulanase